MHKTVVINAVGLTPRLLGPSMPRLTKFAHKGKISSVGSIVPAVTTTVQSTYLTGTWPSEHGIVGNGWYFRDESEIRFWHQSARLVQRPRIWDAARRLDPAFTCANLFWWYAMYSSADYTVTPRPMYPADGRKIPDVWAHPESLRRDLQKELGQFPLFNFWGPATSIRSTRWIADAALRVNERHNPTLTLIYLPHLDYCLQKHGPDASACAADLADLDTVCGDLIDAFEAAGARVIVLSEYGITPVSRPVHLNRVLRERGLLAVREEMGRELLDAGESAAFAVADHQVAHVYVNAPERLDEVRALLLSTAGVQTVLDAAEKRELHLDHPRAGDLVAIADSTSWFTYYYWQDDARMPDFARTVDIHRKPGYDPVELFIDPGMKFPKARIASILLRKKLGLRTLMNVIPADAGLVRGSHGRPAGLAEEGPLLMTRHGALLPAGPSLGPTEVFGVILRHLTELG